MAIAFDTATKSVRTATTDPWEFSHTPIGVPRAIVLGSVNFTSDADQITGVTYGGTAMTRIARAVDTAGEPTESSLWFLGDRVPTGTQTVSIDFSSATGDDFLFSCLSFTAGTTQVVVQDTDVREGDQSNPQVTLTTGGYSCIAVFAFGGGLNDVSLYTDVSGQTRDDENDSGNEVQIIGHQTTASTSDFTVGFTSAADDVSLAAANLREAGVSIAPGVGALTVTGLAPVLLLALTVIPSLGAVAYQGYAPSVQITISPGAGEILLNFNPAGGGYPPTVVVTTGVNIQVPAGTLAVTGVGAALATTAQVPSGTLTVTGGGVSVATAVTVPAGTLTVAGAAPDAVRTLLRQPDVGAILLAGATPRVLTGVILPLPVGSLTLSGSSPDVLQGATVTPGAGAVALEGSAPTVLQTFLVSVPAGVLTVTGQAPDVNAPQVRELSAGALTLTGLAPVVVMPSIVEVPMGSLALAGTAPTMTIGGRDIVIPMGSLVLTGTEVYTLVAPPDPVPVAATTRPLRRLRRAPSLVTFGRWMFHQRFELLLEAGRGLTTGQGRDPQLMVRWSDNGGHTWSDEHWVSAGRVGRYRHRAIWRRLGRSRTRVYEVVLSDPIKVAWIHAALDVQAGAS